VLKREKTKFPAGKLKEIHPKRERKRAGKSEL
jgi:hypothetical protein